MLLQILQEDGNWLGERKIKELKAEEEKRQKGHHGSWVSTNKDRRALKLG